MFIFCSGSATALGEGAGACCEEASVKAGLAKLSFIQPNSERKRILAGYLGSVGFNEKVLVDAKLSIQTGRYQQVSASSQALNSKCMTAIVQAAYQLHNHFPNYSFVVDSHIHNCHNLKEGVKQLIANERKVRENIDRFHSPLHAVFLTNRTRFVHRELGLMGLHIDVNRSGEIRKRLIDYQIGSIPTDSILSASNP